MLMTVSTGPETPASDPYRFVRRQVVSLAGATVLAVVFARGSTTGCWPGGPGGSSGAFWALLVVALAMPQQLGAHRWIPIGEMGQLQPSEFTKIALILWTAGFADRRGERLASLLGRVRAGNRRGRPHERAS